MTAAIGGPGSMEPAQLRVAFAAFPSGVVAVAALAQGTPVGVAASSFTSVSLEPPIVSVSMAKTSTTWPRLRAASTIGLSVLSASQSEACRTLAGSLGADRFAGVEWESTDSGAVVMGGAALWLECTVDGEVDAGDHWIVLLRIHQLERFDEVEPLVFHGSKFRRLEAEISA